jgi:FkbM family methyltransferase
MSLTSRISNNLIDMRVFGPSAVLRHFARLKSDRVATISAPGVGPVYIRTGESDIAAMRQVFVRGDYDIDWPVELAARLKQRYDAILADGGRPIIVDAGANIGAASLWFGHAYPQARVVSVEPDPGNAAILRRNVGHRANHVILEAAIGAEPGFVSLVNEGLGWAVQTKRAETGLPVVTVDDAFEASGGDTPFIVKVDIEGFERDLFASNTAWLERCYAVIIEPHDWMLPGEMSSRTFQQAMAQHPFELYMRGENIVYARV